MSIGYFGWIRTVAGRSERVIEVVGCSAAKKTTFPFLMHLNIFIRQFVIRSGDTNHQLHFCRLTILSYGKCCVDAFMRKNDASKANFCFPVRSKNVVQFRAMCVLLFRTLFVIQRLNERSFFILQFKFYTSLISDLYSGIVSNKHN